MKWRTEEPPGERRSSARGCELCRPRRHHFFLPHFLQEPFDNLVNGHLSRIDPHGRLRFKQGGPLMLVIAIALAEVLNDHFISGFFAISNKLLEAAHRPLLDAGVEEKLDVGIGKNNAALISS